MIWVMGMQRRFDLACFLVRGMHPESVLTQQAVVIVMERFGEGLTFMHIISRFCSRTWTCVADPRHGCARVSRMAFLENGASCSRFHIFRGGNRVPCLNFQVCWQSSNVPCAVHLVGIRDAIENGGAASSLANRTKAHRPVSIFLSRFK
ncbi:hypothetical protein MUK42_33788 [Musa troglodytarum]|uniref:Uncharacterized protein n=1 Tax=Musa troglodytarum TaxID=320322 RepID=A0A9E7KR65_9LILI|nr:hypothetical protein MUK42_33788 [Musa troglodytarum]